MNKLFLDIETIPAGEKLSLLEVDAPSNYKDEEKILQYKKDKIEEEYLKRSIVTYKSEIICICYAFDDEPTTSISKLNYAQDFGIITEEDLIREFYNSVLSIEQLRKDMQSAIIVGHNVMFDIKTITQRFFKYGIHALEFSSLTPYHPRVFDTMKAFTLGDRQDYVSLDTLAKFLGFEQTKLMKGSDVYKQYQDGNLQQIVEYCKGDVELVRKVYNKLTI